MSGDDDVFEAFRALGFRADKETLRSILQTLTKSRASPTETCEKLVALERRERDRQNLDRRTQVADLGAFKTLERFDWNHPKSIDRQLFETLHGLDFIEQGENVLFRGTAGLGKTTLAQNLGLAALHKGYTVRFITLAEALADLLKQESLPAFERRLRRYVQVDLLILDEIGYLACDTRSADLLYNIISRRHEKRSTIISTNLPFKQWTAIFPGAACVVAMVDRFVQHCHVMDIEGESWRPKDSEPPPKRGRHHKR
jgi:DNA replication protein DnaC